MHPDSLCYEFCGPGGIVSGFSGDALADVIPREPHAQPVVASDEIPGEFAVVDRHVACELSRLLRQAQRRPTINESAHDGKIVHLEVIQPVS